MAQVIVAQNSNGIVMAAEQAAVRLDEEGQEITFQAERLLPLTAQSAVLTIGAADGIEMGNALKHFIREEQLADIEDVYSAALPYLSTEYERFMRKTCDVLPIDPIHQVSFILAGKTEKNPGMPFKLYLLWTKRKLPRLDGDEISFAYSQPRRMGLEYRLNKVCRADGPLEEILRTVREGMEALKKQGEVRFPIAYGTIDQERYQALEE